MNTKTLTAAVTLIFLFTAAPSLAKKNPPPQPPPGDEHREEMREKITRRLETLMMMRVAEDMSLPADKEEKLLFMLKNTISERQKRENELREAMKELESAYDRHGAEADLEKAISRLEKLQRERNLLETDFLGKLRKTLTARETARFILVWPRVEEEMRGAIKELKDRRGPGNMHGEGPGGKPPEF